MQLQGKLPLQNSPAMDIFKQLVTSFDSEGRYHLFNAMANQLRYPNRYIPTPALTRLPYCLLYFLTCYVMLCHVMLCYVLFCPADFTIFDTFAHAVKNRVAPLLTSLFCTLLFLCTLYSHTHYFSCVVLALFGEADSEAVQEQITRVLLERLIVHRPHPVRSPPISIILIFCHPSFVQLTTLHSSSSDE